ncbi:sialate O-acetylesterase [Formosa undariae]|uniref:Sialate O-acetylesterase n=1 Tax=Formosa undariae TaxID=1325436 RepID=A0ABV5F011_9FLAO
MKSKIIKYLSFTMVLSVMCFSKTFATTLRLGSPFQEHMVLQCDMPIAVWGEAVPNTLVVISLGEDKASVTSDSEGLWRVYLPTRKPGGPYAFSVNSGVENIIFKDVLIGEVWICTGQSNMAMGYNGIPEIKQLDTLISKIRTFKVDKTVSFTEQDYLKGNWVLQQPNSAVAFSFAYFLQKSKNVPIGIILTAWGSSSIEGWMPRDMTETLPHFKNIMNDFDNDIEKKSRIDSIIVTPGKRIVKDDIFIRTQPNIIYNAILKPILPYSCRGIVWYQGEANAKNVDAMLQYGITLPLWIERIRSEWEQDSPYLLGVMLPGYGGTLYKKVQDTTIFERPDANSWAWIRESQLKALELPNVSIVNTIDLGDVKNIHPKDKLPIGKRLALYASSDGKNSNSSVDGPILKKVSVKSNIITVFFNNGKGLKTRDGKTPKAFWLTDRSGEWYPAKAIIKGETVELSSEKLSKPLYVRYAFSAKPYVNLVNTADLPARPFRTDNFLPIVNADNNN